MKTYQLLWRIMRYQPWVFILSALLTAIFFCFRIIFGYVIQTFFNILPTSKHLSPILWEVIALLAATAAARFLLTLGGGMIRPLGFFITQSLLRRNLLERILERPGAQAVPGSTGAVINIFQNDTENIANMFGWLYAAIGLFRVLHWCLDYIVARQRADYCAGFCSPYLRCSDCAADAGAGAHISPVQS